MPALLRGLGLGPPAGAPEPGATRLAPPRPQEEEAEQTFSPSPDLARTDPATGALRAGQRAGGHGEPFRVQVGCGKGGSSIPRAGRQRGHFDLPGFFAPFAGPPARPHRSACPPDPGGPSIGATVGVPPVPPDPPFRPDHDPGLRAAAALFRATIASIRAAQLIENAFHKVEGDGERQEEVGVRLMAAALLADPRAS